MVISEVTFDKLPKAKEGIVLMGAGGDLNEWVKGVIVLKTSGGRTDLLLVIPDSSTLQIGKLAMWRLRFGDASWLSDYKFNYADQH
jgi:hypothetical protein